MVKEPLVSPSEAMWVRSQPSMAPWFQAACWSRQSCDRDGTAAAPVVMVDMCHGSRYPSGLAGSGCWNTDRPVGSRIAVGSLNPRAPGKVPKKWSKLRFSCIWNTRCLTWDRSNSRGLLVAARARLSGRTPASPAAPATAAALATNVRRPILGPERCLRFSVINVSSSSRGPCASGLGGGGRACGVAGLGEAGDFGDLAVVGVGDVEVVGAGVDRDAVGGVELGRGGGLAAALAAGRGRAGGRGGGGDDGGDGARGGGRG